jgi:hypothetical protein
MPRFNDSAEPTPEIGYHWFDQTRFIFQDCKRGTCRLALSDGTVLADVPIHSVIANGRGTYAYVQHVERADATQVPYRDSFGRSGVNMFPVAIGPEGNIAVKPHSNVGTRVLEPDGSEWPLPHHALTIQLLSGKRAMWTEGGIVQANFAIVGNPGKPVTSPRVADDGTLLYQDVFNNVGTGALVLGGKVIGPPSDKYFNPDVMLIGDTYHVVWALSTADVPVEPLKVTKAQLAALPEVGVPQPQPTPIPQPIPPEPTPVPMFTPQMPNRLDVVEKVKREHPEEWAARADLRFIKRVAWELGRIDDRFGLLGKRGTDDIAADAIAYLNPTVDPQLSAELSCEAADIIVGSHTADPKPGWNPITVPVRAGGAGAKWIQPTRPGEIVEPQPIPVDLTAVLTAILADIATLKDEIRALKIRVRDLGEERLIDDQFITDTFARFKELNERIDERIALCAKYGDPVEVSGRLSFGVNRWGGIISKK